MAINGKKSGNDPSPPGVNQKKNEPWRLFLVGIVILGIITVVLIIVSVAVLTGWMKW